MKLCIPVEKDEGTASRICGHFGSAPVFVVIDPATMEYETVDNSNAHHAHGMCSPLAALGSHSVDSILLNGIGRRALDKLSAMGITVYRSDTETVGEAVKKHQEGALEVMTADNACAQHGQHHHGRVQGFVDI